MSDPIPTTQGSPTTGTKSDATSAPVANPVKPSEITLSTIWQGLTVGQFWGLCGALLGLVIGAFLFGMWMEKQRSEVELNSLKDQNKKLVRANEVYLKKQTLMDHYLRYYQSESADKVTASKMFVFYLKELWNGGTQDMEKNGYQVYKTPDNLLKSYVMFAGDPIHYKIPKDIKVSVHDAFK